MKYKYYFCNEVVEIDVPDEWGRLLLEMDQEEYKNNRREYRRTSSLEEIDPDDLQMASDDDVEATVFALFDHERIEDALQMLSSRERNLIEQVYFHKKSYSTIAFEEGVNESSIRRATERAYKHLKNKLLNR